MVWSTPRTWVTSEVVTAAHMNQEVRDNLNALFPQEDAGVSWSPDLQATGTNPTLETQSGRLYKIGALQFGWGRFVFVGTGGGSGEYLVELPEPAVGITATLTGGQAIGQWLCSDVSAPVNNEAGVVTLATSSTIRFRRPNGARLTDSNAFVFTTDDVLSFSFCYPWA